jgi:hypothetical protein
VTRTPPDPGLTEAEITTLVRPGTKDAESWARDVRTALVAARQVPDRDHVCQVLAVIEQESGYHADPAVEGLGAIVDQGIHEALDSLGPLEGPTRKALLDHAPPGETRTFEQRIETVRTEQDVDRLFQDVVAYHRTKAPKLAHLAELLFPRLLERYNPIATAGSMQVSVAWAQSIGRDEGLDAQAVREQLYTQTGGVHYGVRRLFDGADYDEPIFRFADYNAGQWASRNAAFQIHVSTVTGLDVVADGDLLAYDRSGRPSADDGETMTALLAWRLQSAPDLNEGRLRRDVRKEKEKSFEETETWTRVRADFETVKGRPPKYATIPEVALVSPKLSKSRTTRWFAEMVERRYRSCLARGAPKPG